MLKLWAVIFMTLDHIGAYLQPFMSEQLYMLLRAVGRLAFPIFAYHVARGYSLTRNPARYFFRMLIFAFAGEVLIRYGYSIASLKTQGTNVMFTFALAIVMITGYRLIWNCGRDMIASLRPITTGPPAMPPPRYDVRVNIFGISLDCRTGTIIGFGLMLAAMILASVIRSDYDIYGLLTVLIFYIVLNLPGPDYQHEDARKLHPAHDPLHEQQAFWLLLVLNVMFSLGNLSQTGASLFWSLLQNFSLLSVPIIFHSRQQRKRPGSLQKYFFYFYYPLHIFLVLLLRVYLSR